MENKVENILTLCRPKSLAEFVCCSDTKLKLLKVLENPERFKTYLLSGPSGIGKTTFARIFAKNLNSQTDVHDETEYIEINCADTRGIDFARDLLTVLNSRPLMHRNKVVVLDEAHMITTQAQNTLLKGLEEVPKENYVLLCSTRPDSLIPTIRTRCYEINLTPKTLEDVGLRTSLRSYGKTIGQKICPKMFLPDSDLDFLDSIIVPFLDKNVPEHLSVRQFTSYLVDIFSVMEDGQSKDVEQLVQSAIKNTTDRYDPILLARFLIKQKGKGAFDEKYWPLITEKISNLNCSIESARLMILSYMNKVLITTENTSTLILCSNIMTLLMFDGTGSDARSRMYLAFRHMFNLGQKLSELYL